MKKFFIILLLFLIFITLNFTNLEDFYNSYLWKINYENKDFLKAEKYFKKSAKKESIYNLANTYYKQKKYKDSKETFESILTDKENNFNFLVKSNLGNVYFRIWELEKPKENWEKSLDFYRNALKIKYDEKIEKNLKFVLDKLNKLEASSENNGESWRRAEEKSEENNGESWRRAEEKSEEKKEGNNKRSEKSFKKEESYNLTEEQKAELKKYEEKLKKSELENWDSFAKVYKEGSGDFSDFEEFFNDPFFDDSLLNSRDNVRDW